MKINKLASLIIGCLIGLSLLMGMRRYSPVFWRAVSGGIQYVGANLFEDTDIVISTKTIIKTISIDDDASTDDFQFDDDQSNSNEQKVNLGNLIPTYGELLSAELRCFETVTDSGGDAVMAIDLGTATGGAEIFATADIDSANDISATGAGDGPEIVATAAAKAVWINATPDVDWDTFLTGRWSVMITYIDYGAVHTAGIP